MTDERIKELANKWCLHPTDNAWDEVIGFAHDLLAEQSIDAVNISKKYVDETAKGEHEPVYMDMSRMPTGIPDWKPGMVLPLSKREWIGLTDEQINEIAEYHGIDGLYETSRIDFYHAIEAKLKEKNA